MGSQQIETTEGNISSSWCQTDGIHMLEGGCLVFYIFSILCEKQRTDLNSLVSSSYYYLLFDKYMPRFLSCALRGLLLFLYCLRKIDFNLIPFFNLDRFVCMLLVVFVSFPFCPCKALISQGQNLIIQSM